MIENNDLSTSSSPSPLEHDELTFNTAPNILTLFRFLFVPFVVGLLFFNERRTDWIAALVFIIAAITDYFDGYLARSRKQVTIYGKLMDPLADKFLVVSSVVMLQYLGRIHPTVVILLICRELAITGLRALASAEGVIIAASDSAKWKTASQMIALPLIMIQAPGEPALSGIPFYPLGMGLLYISLGMSLWSAKDYVVAFFKELKETRRRRLEEKKRPKQNKKLSRKMRLAAKKNKIYE
jgi:CDP-diacylglycerol--glycerol-3-phosphate 3-phosphatidyltransferase